MNKIFIKYLTILIFISSCGYNPIFSNKNSNFSIKEVRSTGNKKLNIIINNKLNNYQGVDAEKVISVSINTNINKEISSKDTKGNPKTFRIEVKSKAIIKDSNGNVKEKLFSKSTSYNNLANKFELKKFENETAKNLAEKISEEIVFYLYDY